jgi:hypothetical protein
MRTTYLPKKHEVFDFLLSGSIDIALINETYLKQSVPFTHPIYKFYRLDRTDRSKGGVAKLVHQDLPHMLLSSFRMRILECIGVSVFTASGRLEFILTHRQGLIVPE